MKPFLFILSVFLLNACGSKNNFEVLDFNPLSNFECTQDTLSLSMDLSGAIVDGISIPSIKQCKNGYFKMSFKILNNSNKAQRFYYKIYYQNDSYKFSEFINVNDTITYNSLSNTNFYGSWEEPLDSLHITRIIPNDNKPHIVTDSFRIIGNPRNELKYFGSKTTKTVITKEMIQKASNEIINTPEWFKSIKDKAEKNNISVDEQLKKDVLWYINEKTQKGSFNNRWKRNPRVGDYSFVLAVAPVEDENTFPETIRDIQKLNSGEFINPFFDLLYNKSVQEIENLSIVKSKKVLKTKAIFDLGSGVFVDEGKVNTPKLDTSFYSENCGSSNNMYVKAQFEQLFHNINKNYQIKNVPFAADVIKENYSQGEYIKNAEKYKKNELFTDFIQITNSPGRTVNSDVNNKKLIIKNPGNTSNKFKKENVGVNSRIGFTYGKFIAKIQFPAIINKDNVWNGLTCAYWLKFQDTKEWNNRTICDSIGYISKSEDGPKAQRVTTDYYSEIDFEILKTSKYWPKTSYSNTKAIPQDDPKANQNIIVTCTNWDLACMSPTNFIVGAKEVTFNDKQYVLHRWDDWYKAITIKHEIHHDSIFNKPAYFEIDWQPDKIIWRIGSSRNNMIVVGYMDNTVTTIPDNQMVIVFSQEFHDSNWWPLSPFIQDLIPFPTNDIQGEILELLVE